MSMTLSWPSSLLALTKVGDEISQALLILLILRKSTMALNDPYSSPMGSQSTGLIICFRTLSEFITNSSSFGSGQNPYLLEDWDAEPLPSSLAVELLTFVTVTLQFHDLICKYIQCPTQAHLLESIRNCLSALLSSQPP